MSRNGMANVPSSGTTPNMSPLPPPTPPLNVFRLPKMYASYIPKKASNDKHDYVSW